MHHLKPLSLLLAASLAAAPVQAAEEPAFERLRQEGNFEVRRYAPYLVAEVRVDGDFERAGNQGFRLLANYIFGGNQGERKLAMTAPVIQSATPVQLPMTAPVTQTALAEGGFVVQFVLPAGLTLDSAPLPNNPRVQLREEPARVLAVQRYSGSWSRERYERELAALRQAAEQAGVRLQGEPVLSRFNGPLTPPWMRRNEIWMAVQQP